MDAIIVFGRVLAVGSESLHKAVEGLCQLCHIGHEGRPVVLFEVDVYGVVASPGRPKVGCPETLQISRNIVCPRGGNQQIASELEIEFFEVAALASAIGIGLEKGIGGEAG